MNKLTTLRSRIEAMMTENEVIKTNAVAIQTDRAVQMYSNARRENIAYQNVLEEIDKLESEAGNE